MIIVNILATLMITAGPGNFTVSGENAAEVGAYAEHSRKHLAEEYFGEEFPQWWQRAQIQTQSRKLSSETSFSFVDGDVYNWTGKWNGDLHSLQTSIIPHEVSHMVLASKFRAPVARWFDEGMAQLAESAYEQGEFLTTAKHFTKRMSIKNVFALEEYPRTGEGNTAFYLQSYLLCNHAVSKVGKRKFVDWYSARRNLTAERMMTEYLSSFGDNHKAYQWGYNLQACPPSYGGSSCATGGCGQGAYTPLIPDPPQYYPPQSIPQEYHPDPVLMDLSPPPEIYAPQTLAPLPESPKAVGPPPATPGDVSPKGPGAGNSSKERNIDELLLMLELVLAEREERDIEEWKKEISQHVIDNLPPVVLKVRDPNGNEVERRWKLGTSETLEFIPKPKR